MLGPGGDKHWHLCTADHASLHFCTQAHGRLHCSQNVYQAHSI